jgi:C_GCAxxG_C_C family probable redox protein
MWEAYGLENEDLLWAGMAFRGGIGGQQRAACGAVEGAAVSLGLLHRRPLDDKEAVEKARKAAMDEAGQLVREFVAEYGGLSCIELIDVDLSVPGAGEKAAKEGVFQRCDGFVNFAIRKLYELEEKRAK